MPKASRPGLVLKSGVSAVTRATTEILIPPLASICRKMKHPGLREPTKESAAVAGDLGFHASKTHRGTIIRSGVFDLLFLRTARQIHVAYEDDIGLRKRKNGLVFAAPALYPRQMRLCETSTAVGHPGSPVRKIAARWLWKYCLLLDVVFLVP